MKKIIIICLLVIGMMTNAQTNQVITKKLQLNNVPSGSETDNFLVRGTDGIVKFVPRSSFGGDSSVHIAAGYNVTISGSGDINNPYVINAGSSYSTNGASYSDNPFTAYCFIYPDRGFQYYKYSSPRNEGRWAQSTLSEDKIYFQQSGNAEWPNNNDRAIELLFPKPASGFQSKTIPISLNGNYADVNGNIEVSPISTTFTTNDGKTVTVTNGIITSIQ